MPQIEDPVALCNPNFNRSHFKLSGLVINAKRPTKKRRKKKTNPEVPVVTSDQHRGSSSSEANVLHMAASKAITILKREESEEEAESIKEDIIEVSAPQQPFEVDEVSASPQQPLEEINLQEEQTRCDIY